MCEIWTTRKTHAFLVCVTRLTDFSVGPGKHMKYKSHALATDHTICLRSSQNPFASVHLMGFALVPGFVYLKREMYVAFRVRFVSHVPTTIRVRFLVLLLVHIYDIYTIYNKYMLLSPLATSRLQI